MVNDDMDGRLILELEPRVGEDKRKYYLAKLKGPFTIDCKDGVVFFVFTSSEGMEELQIANMKKKPEHKNDRR